MRLPAGARARRPARGGRRGHPRAVDRRPGHPAVAVLSADRRGRAPGPGSAAADHRSAARRAAGARLAGRIGDGWYDVRRQLRAAPAALPRVARGEPAGGARTRPCSSGSRATGWRTSRSATRPWIHGAARDLGALARGRGGRGDRPGPHDRRRRRARGGGRALVSRFVAPSTGDPDESEPTRAARAAPAPVAPTRLPTPASPTHPCARCGAPVGPGIGLCERCNPLGLRDSRGVAGARDGLRGRGPRDRRCCSSWPACRSRAAGRIPASLSAVDPDRRRPRGDDHGHATRAPTRARRPAGSSIMAGPGRQPRARSCSARASSPARPSASRPSSPSSGRTTRARRRRAGRRDAPDAGDDAAARTRRRSRAPRTTSRSGSPWPPGRARCSWTATSASSGSTTRAPATS